MAKINLGLVFSLFFVFISKSVEISDNFFKALGQVESGQNPKAYNKDENAIGIYQIRKLYFIDAQNFTPELKKYRHEDCFNEKISRKIVLAYLSKYCKNGSFEDFARCHNSGSNWKNKKHLTQKYWNKIKKELDKFSE